MELGQLFPDRNNAHGFIKEIGRKINFSVVTQTRKIAEDFTRYETRNQCLNPFINTFKVTAFISLIKTSFFYRFHKITSFIPYTKPATRYYGVVKCLLYDLDKLICLV